MRNLSRQNLTMATAICVFAGVVSAQANTTYFLDYTFPVTGGDITASGSITVDTLGAIDSSNVVDWSLTFSSPTYPGPTVLTPLNSSPDLAGVVTATATELQLLLSDPSDGNGDEGNIRFRGDAFPVDFVFLNLQTGEGSPNEVLVEHTPGFASPYTDPRDDGAIDVGGPGTFAFASVPEPAVLTLLALSGLALWRRR